MAPIGLVRDTAGTPPPLPLPSTVSYIKSAGTMNIPTSTSSSSSSTNQPSFTLSNNTVARSAGPTKAQYRPSNLLKSEAKSRYAKFDPKELDNNVISDKLQAKLLHHSTNELTGAPKQPLPLTTDLTSTATLNHTNAPLTSTASSASADSTNTTKTNTRDPRVADVVTAADLADLDAPPAKITAAHAGEEEDDVSLASDSEVSYKGCEDLSLARRRKKIVALNTHPLSPSFDSHSYYGVKCLRNINNKSSDKVGSKVKGGSLMKVKSVDVRATFMSNLIKRCCKHLYAGILHREAVLAAETKASAPTTLETEGESEGQNYDHPPSPPSEVRLSLDGILNQIEHTMDTSSSYNGHNHHNSDPSQQSSMQYESQPLSSSQVSTESHRYINSAPIQPHIESKEPLTLAQQLPLAQPSDTTVAGVLNEEPPVPLENYRDIFISNLTQLDEEPLYCQEIGTTMPLLGGSGPISTTSTATSEPQSESKCSDTRVCCFCHASGPVYSYATSSDLTASNSYGTSTSGSEICTVTVSSDPYLGRLLPTLDGLYVHINCLRWSDGVAEQAGVLNGASLVINKYDTCIYICIYTTWLYTHQLHKHHFMLIFVIFVLCLYYI